MSSWLLSHSGEVARLIGIINIPLDHVMLMNNSYVTGYWKTDHNVTQAQVHFIVPANSLTHALPMHSVLARLC